MALGGTAARSNRGDPPGTGVPHSSRFGYALRGSSQRAAHPAPEVLRPVPVARRTGPVCPQPDQNAAGGWPAACAGTAENRPDRQGPAPDVLDPPRRASSRSARSWVPPPATPIGASGQGAAAAPRFAPPGRPGRATGVWRRSLVVVGRSVIAATLLNTPVDGSVAVSRHLRGTDERPHAARFQKTLRCPQFRA